MARGVIPNEDAFDRFSKATRHYESTYRDKPLEGKRRVILGGGGKVFEGYLCEDLDAAENTLNSPTSATAVKLVKNNSTGDLEHGPSVTITNRDTTLTLEAWTYIHWTKINGENRITWAACEGEVSSSCEEE